MLTSMILAQGPTRDNPQRWPTGPAPAQPWVIAARSVTEATIASSPGPGEDGGVMSSSRSVRPGRASRWRSMDPIRPDPPVMTMIGTAVDLTRPVPQRRGRGGRESAPKRGSGSGSWVTGRVLPGVGLGVTARAGEETEISARVRLGDVLAVQRAVAALEPAGR